MGLPMHMGEGWNEGGWPNWGGYVLMRVGGDHSLWNESRWRPLPVIQSLRPLPSVGGWETIPWMLCLLSD